jgi:hypothetical protein
VLPPEQHQGQELDGDVRGGDRGHLGVVVSGRDLDHVAADQAFPGQAAQDAEQLPGGQAAGLRGSRARRTTAAAPEG